jgi:hypothetical protein
MKNLIIILLINLFAFNISFANKPAEPDSVVFTSSNLPIVVIDTHGQTIHNSYRIIADMGIINNPNVERNNIADPFTDYNGKISIEIRGSSSTMFDKKPYGFETQDASGNNLNVPLLSLPSENDWILYASYSDKTFLRNEIPYYLSRLIGRYGSRTAYCELVINGSYRGLYVLMEKIKQDKNRVDIAKLNPEDTTGIELTGGYILKVDKPYDFGWQVNVEPLYGFDKTFYQYHDPDSAELAPKQRAYIKDFMFKVESTLVSSNYKDSVNGYAKYIDVPSAVDYFIISEIAKSVDAYRFSFYMYKEKDNDGGKLHFGPLWDYDLAFANYGENAWEQPWKTSDWNAEITAWKRTYLMKRLFTDPNFKEKIKQRWIELRSSVFSYVNILEYMDQTVNKISEARIRNFIKWPIIGVYVWPNYYIGATYEDEVNFLKGWIIQRINWMDIELTGSPISNIDEQNTIVTDFKLEQNYPNPFNPSTTISWQSPVSSWQTLKIFNSLGQEVETIVDGYYEVGVHSKLYIVNSSLPSGVYFYQLKVGEYVSTKKMLFLK